jgi:hypothetical protein
MNKLALLGVLVLGLIVIGTQADDIRSGLNGIATGWFESLQKPQDRGKAQEQAWRIFATRANALCASYAHQGFAAQVMSPRSRDDWIRQVRAGLARERDLQTALSAMHAPGNYDVGYRKFLRDREAALSAVAHLRSAVQQHDRDGGVRALRSYTLVQGQIRGFAARGGLPACMG